MVVEGDNIQGLMDDIYMTVQQLLEEGEGRGRRFAIVRNDEMG